MTGTNVTITPMDQVNLVVRTGLEPVPYDLYFIIGAYAVFIQWCRPTAASNQFRHLTIFSSFRDVNTDILCTIQDSHIVSLVEVRIGFEPTMSNHL